jgi:formylmethanofuran dehydrogenase subunit E
VATLKGKDRLAEFFTAGAKFHGHLSPGLTIGIFMVDLAQELMGPRELMDAVAETKLCLPDAVQVMTPCSYGNGWLTVKDWGKFAVTLFDKKARDGVRVYVDHNKIKNYPLLYQWYMRQGKADDQEVIAEIMEAGRSILSWEKVTVQLPPKEKSPVAICAACGETYPTSLGAACPRCNGRDDYYQVSKGEPQA